MARAQCLVYSTIALFYCRVHGLVSELHVYNCIPTTHWAIILLSLPPICRVRLEILLYVSILFRFAVFFLIRWNAASPSVPCTRYDVPISFCRLPIGITSLVWLGFVMSLFSVLNIFVPRAQWAALCYWRQCVFMHVLITDVMPNAGGKEMQRGTVLWCVVV